MCTLQPLTTSPFHAPVSALTYWELRTVIISRILALFLVSWEFKKVNIQFLKFDASSFSARVYTVPITLHYQRTTYVTNFVTLYSTSCSVSQRPSPSPTPTPTTTTPTKSISVGSTTTQNSPSQTLSTVTGSSDTGVHNLGAGGKGTAVTRKVSVGAIVGGVLGGLVAAALLGILVFKLW